METIFRIFLFCASVLFCMIAFPGNAQSRYDSRVSVMTGLEGGYGIQSATIRSTIPELHDLSWTAEGGKVMYLTGNRTLLTRCGLGFYYSAANVPQTIDLFYGELGLNFYPLSLSGLSNLRLNPYLLAGVYYNMFKFGGTYLNQDAEPRNLSVVDENYLGRLNQINAMAGGGMEFRILDEREFLNVFAEGSWAIPLISRASTSAFNGTSTGNLFQVYVGVRFGLVRNR